jgi:YYY domain-containing protein
VSIWHQAWAIIAWWIGLSALGLLTYPLIWRLFRHLPDAGFALSKVTGLLLVSYAVWLVASSPLLGFTRSTLLILLLIIALLSGATLRRRSRHSFLEMLRGRWRSIVEIELVTLAAFLVCLFIRMYGPEIIGAEKFMDYSFLNALGRARSFPPHDPWLSGATLNYYYFGYLTMAVVTKLLALPSRLTYNLSVAFIFAVLVGAAYSLAWSISGRRRYGVAASLFVAIAGNLDGLYQILGGSGLLQFDWWRSTRIIEGTINEFPYFTVLFADLHPHLLSLPLVVLILHLLYRLAVPEEQLAAPPVTSEGSPFSRVALPAKGGEREGGNIWSFFSRQELWALALLALLLGALNVANFWDFPTYLMLSGFALLVGIAGRWQGRAPSAWIPIIVRSLLVLVVLTGLALLLFLPFYRSFHSHFRGIGIVEKRTPLSDLVTLFVLPLFLGGTHIIARMTQLVRSLGRFARELFLYSMAAFMVAAYAVFSSWGTSIVATYLACIIVLLVVQGRRGWRELETLLFIGCGLLLLLLAELFHLQDSYGEDLERMNTVFKLHFQAWILLGLGSALALWRLEQGPLSRMRRPGRRIWYGALAAVLLGVFVYPVVATYAKCGGFRRMPTLDGMAYIAAEHPDDYAAIEWFNEHVRGTPTIVEAAGPPYSYFARFSTNTGLPAVLGWANHELLWRDDFGEVGKRENDIRRLYETVDPEEARGIADRYGIDYICYGELEREAYAVSEEQLLEIWPLAFAAGECRIFEAEGRHRESTGSPPEGEARWGR